MLLRFKKYALEVLPWTDAIKIKDFALLRFCVDSEPLDVYNSTNQKKSQRIFTSNNYYSSLW